MPSSIKSHNYDKIWPIIAKIEHLLRGRHMLDIGLSEITHFYWYLDFL